MYYKNAVLRFFFVMCVIVWSESFTVYDMFDSLGDTVLSFFDTVYLANVWCIYSNLLLPSLTSEGTRGGTFTLLFKKVNKGKYLEQSKSSVARVVFLLIIREKIFFFYE